jgi:hypothetical protein
MGWQAGPGGLSRGLVIFNPARLLVAPAPSAFVPLGGALRSVAARAGNRAGWPGSRAGTPAAGPAVQKSRRRRGGAPHQARHATRRAALPCHPTPLHQCLGPCGLRQPAGTPQRAAPLRPVRGQTFILGSGGRAPRGSQHRRRDLDCGMFTRWQTRAAGPRGRRAWGGCAAAVGGGSCVSTPARAWRLPRPAPVPTLLAAAHPAAHTQYSCHRLAFQRIRLWDGNCVPPLPPRPGRSCCGSRHMQLW